ncbi:glycosyltransferase [Aquihabitans daechungensis]|uniref:glycosyltransferase n=1 Tax=Aquihabitans daechungensis TaxID=1052257 RepID=UPI003B9EC258
MWSRSARPVGARAPTGRSPPLTSFSRRDPRIRWHWIGRGPEPGWEYAYGADLPVTFHPPHADPWSVVDAPAALVVTSREDPLPLVALEAGARDVPVIACSGSGGLDHLLADGRGRLVDPTDPSDLAAVVHDVAMLGATDHDRALRTYVATHHHADVVGPRWLAALTGTP